ncbi:MAG TPA: nitrate- and nitrite sensing domain-containing protein [Actinomycetales bacterium]|nr:nitrate- and nitrite sensing domain-containing protein [Actinomycetales bacterium]
MKNWVNSHPSRAEAVPTGSPGAVTGIERKVAMLRNLGIRSKILAVLALPVVVLLLAATIIAGGAVADARRAVEVEKLAAQAPGLTQLIRGLQAERALSTAQLSGSPAPQLEEVRKQVSGGLQAVRGGIADIKLDRIDDGAAQAVAAAQKAHDQIESLRRQVDGSSVRPEIAFQSYSDVIREDVELAGRIGLAVEDRNLSQNLIAYTSVERLIEATVVERDLATPAVAAGQLPPDLRQQLTGLVMRQALLRDDANGATEAVDLTVPATSYPLQLARQRTIEDTDGKLEGIDVETWRGAAQTEISALESTQAQLADNAAKRAEVLADQARTRAGQIGIGTALFVALPVLLALFIARGIALPLRRLTAAAGEIRAELPKMVERMQTPGEGPGLTLPDIPVESNDEVGRLARAFNDVNHTTVKVAQEQAALRGSIAAMFVNVARRDQVLLSRQLAFIDQLERSEENPETLEDLFKLDHLATRMRRNAESLLVLAGIDTGRRLRRPMPLSDVIRTASSEIEHYERVDLALRVDPPMVGHMALSTAHLLAELLENATRYSDPHTRVVVSTGSNARGIVVTVTDEGLGMTPDEIADANSRITDPAISEVVGAQRLGFFVVGRLARKLDANVSIKPGRSSGTIVTIELPPSLFVAGTVVEVPGTDEPVAIESAPAETNRITLPDTANAALAARSAETEDEDADTHVPGVAAAGSPTGSDAGAAGEDGGAPLPEVTDVGLPRRSRGGLPKRPAIGSPDVAPAAPAAAAAPAPAAPSPAAAPSVVDGTTPAGLPRRSRGGAAPTAPPTDAPAAPAAPTAPVAPAIPAARTEGSAPVGGGLFSGFRARRAEVADAPAEESTATSSVEAAPLSEPVESLDSPAPVESLEPVESLPLVDPVVPIDEPAAAPLEPVAEQPVADHPLAEHPLAEHPVAVEFEAPADEPPLVVDPAAVVTEPATNTVDIPVITEAVVEVADQRRSAASELSQLATRPTAEPAPAAEAPAASAAPAAAPELPPAPEEPPAPMVGAPAVTILPGGGRRHGLRRNRKRQEATPVQPMSRRELRRLEQGPGTAQDAGLQSAPWQPPVPAPATPTAPIRPAAASGPSMPDFGATAAPPADSTSGVPASGASLPSRPPVPAQGGVIGNGSGPVGETQPAQSTPVLPPPSLFGNPAPGGSTDATTGAPGAPEPAVGPSLGDALRQRSALASEALAELSMLSSYSPASMESKPPSTLTRRTPAATPAAQVAPKPAPAATRRARNAADVRSMLSGFQAGVARGRTSPDGAGEGDHAPSAPSANGGNGVEHENPLHGSTNAEVPTNPTT